MANPANITLANLPGLVSASNPLIDTSVTGRGGARSGGGSDPGYSSNWLSHSQSSRAPAPLLRFSDLISGPATGLGDGVGSGVIVTVWGQGLGDSKGSSKAYFTDAQGTKRECTTYYWKRADGVLPSGPARLWYSHLMQEVALSIPLGSVDGAGTISLEVGGVESNTLPFTVRAGAIYHVKSTGSDSNPGTFDQPFATASYAINAIPAGSTMYIHDVDTGNMTSPTARALYWNNASALSTLDAQFATVAYPGYQPKVIGQKAVEPYNTQGWVVSKLDVYASNYLAVDANDQPVGGVIDSGDTWGIRVCKNSRTIANRITDIVDCCASRYQGAIEGSHPYVGNNKMFGNEVYDYGCKGSSKLHHTTYLTPRDATNPTVEAWEWGWNFLHGNHAKFGIHNYDQPENGYGGIVIGDLATHDNVIVEQGGAGISNGCSTGWDIDSLLYNNVLIECGKAAAWDGVDPLTSDGPEAGGFRLMDSGDGPQNGYLGTMWLRNNLVYRHTPDFNQANAGAFTVSGQSGDNMTVECSHNAVYSTEDHLWIGYTYNAEEKVDNFVGQSNGWHCTVASPVNAATLPSWDSAPVAADPQITLDGCIVTVPPTSPLAGAATSDARTSTHDIYGVPRAVSHTIGPVEATV